jgi:hypothetical protein
MNTLPPSTFTGKFFKKSLHLGFGVFVDIWFMGGLHRNAAMARSCSTASFWQFQLLQLPGYY